MTDTHVADELRRRAAQLAVPPPPPARQDVVEVLVFRWDEAGYAVPTSHVRETLQDVTVTLMPGARPPLLGTATVRSLAVPVIDVRPLLEVPSPRRAVSRLIVLEEGGRPSLALAADDLERLATVPVSELYLQDARPAAVRATTSSGVTLLDADALLDLPPFFAAIERSPL